MRKIISLLAAMAMLVAFAAPAMAATEHCDDHEGHPNKIETSGTTGNDVILAEGTVFCVKASTGATGELTADGETTLQEYLEAEGIRTPNGKNVPDVSYYIIYKAANGSAPPPPPGGPPPTVIVPTPAPTPTPDTVVVVTPAPTPFTNVQPGTVTLPDTATNDVSSLAPILALVVMLALSVVAGRAYSTRRNRS